MRARSKSTKERFFAWRRSAYRPGNSSHQSRESGQDCRPSDCQRAGSGVQRGERDTILNERDLRTISSTVTPALRVRVRQVACSVDAPYRAHLQTMMFLQLVAGGHLMLFLTRTPGAFWKPPFPGSKLFWAIVGTHTRRFAPALTSPTIPGRQYEL
jgi:hypothetical protein